jgi:hypothetical protein
MADEFVFNSNTFPQMSRSSSIVVNQTYSWINNAGFYSAVNATYYAYYYNNVRRLAYWLDGFVPTFHKEENGIFSTRLANSLVNSISEAIFGRELLFKNVGLERDENLDNDSLKKTGDWAKESNFQTEAKKALKYAQGLGTSLIKLNISEGKLWPEAVRLDYFYFEVDAKGNLQEVTCLLKAYTDVSKGEQKEQQNYYVVEKRFYKLEKEKGFERDRLNDIKPKETIVKVPYVVYQVHKFYGNILNNQTYDTSLRETVRWDSIPKKVRDSIKKDYSVIKIGEEQELPFKKHLGAYIVTADEGNISLPQAFPFGTSILENIVSYLMGYDIAYSYFFRDLYMGKATVLIPKFMQNNAGANKLGNRAFVDPFQGLDQALFTTYETTSQEKQVVEQIQFNLRSQEWVQVRDYLVENIAMTLQLSPRTIASFLTGGSIKTATQVSSEDSSSVSFIEVRRAVFEKPLNRLLKDVKEFLNLQDQVEVRFSKEGVINYDQLIQRVGSLMQMGLIDLYSALKEIMIDADEAQVKERFEAIKKEQAEKMEEQLQAAQGMQLM